MKKNIKVKNSHELIKFWLSGKSLYWNDPEPIEGNDYKITFIKDLTGEENRTTPLCIQYNNGKSEAEVFLHEIIIK